MTTFLVALAAVVFFWDCCCWAAAVAATSSGSAKDVNLFTGLDILLNRIVGLVLFDRERIVFKRECYSEHSLFERLPEVGGFSNLPNN